MSIREQALGFVQMNLVMKKISPIAMYWAGLTAKEPTEVAIDALMKRCGVMIAAYPMSAHALPLCTTLSIGLIRARINYPDESLEKALNAMMGAWAKEKGAFSFQFIKSVEHVMRTQKITAKRMTKILNKVLPVDLYHSARERSDVKLRVSTALIHVLSEKLGTAEPE